MTIKELLKKYPDSESGLLLVHVLNSSKEEIYLHSSKNVSKEKLVKFLKLIEKWKTGVPLAYLLGYKYFYGHKFLVNKNVLIPRPETEWIVEKATQFIKTHKNKKLRVLDIATGSGCIPISIYLEASKLFPKARFTASDISEKALRVAQKNANLHKTKVELIQSDLFENITGKFNLITSNLPYVPLSRYKKLYQGLKHEPKLAITDGTDRNALYERFFQSLGGHLNKNGLVILEIDEESKGVLENLLKLTSKTFKAKFYKDIFGRLRYLILK